MSSRIVDFIACQLSISPSTSFANLERFAGLQFANGVWFVELVGDEKHARTVGHRKADLGRKLQEKRGLLAFCYKSV